MTAKVAVGTQLGPYRIESKIGEGGMGEVYRARDTRLNRDVAIKVSAAKFSARFEREAKAIAALNHPNICTLHDVGPNFLVMELVQGETLAARLKRGKLSLDETLRYGGQIASALAAAHARGIIHRDLKPGNIMVAKSGVKLLDFGLAKSAEDATLTATRAVMGTPAYMAPEQFAGKEADARTDIYAFGLVLYETATGKRAPQGETPSMEGVVPQLRPLVERCLSADPDDRWHSAKDLMIILQWKGNTEAAAEPTAVYRRRLRWLAGIAALLTGSFGLLYFRQTPIAPAQPVARLAIPVTTTEPQFVTQFQMALSPDGKRLVYSAGSINLSHLYLRSLDSSEIVRVRGVEASTNVNPFFSPDGQWVGFFAGGRPEEGGGAQLLKVPFNGGVPRMICRVNVTELSQFEGADWGRDDNILFATRNAGLWRVPASGGEPVAITTVARQKGELSHRWPQFLPDGQEILFTVEAGRQGNFHIVAESLATHERRELTPKGIRGRYAPSGHLVYSWENSLLARPFDLGRLEVTGPETVLLENLREDGVGSYQFALSDSGTLVYGLTPPRAERTLAWVNRIGVETPLPAPPRMYTIPRLSPDGRQVAIQIIDEIRTRWDVWTYDLARDILARVTSDGLSGSPIWTLDGKRLVFTRQERAAAQSSFGNLMSQAADGSGQAETLVPSESSQWAGSWSPDGRQLAFMEFNRETLGDIMVLSLDGTRRSRAVVRAPYTQWGGRISPDGRWIAYVSDETGHFEVYVTSFPSGVGKWQISAGGGSEVVWARNGRELYWRNGKQMMSAGIVNQASFVATKPRALFAGYMNGVPGLPEYDVAPDGQRFLMVKGAETENTPSQVNVVLNWFEELKSRAVPGN